MKKYIALLSALALSTALAGCSFNSPAPPPEPAPAPEQSAPQESPTVTDISDPVVGLHEEIMEQTFESDEEIDNLYYKRTSDAGGNPVYSIIRKSDGQTVNLPMSETVVYVTKNGPSYYEKVTVTYKEDGDPTSLEQYELYVQSTEAEAEPVSPDDHPDISITSSIGSSTSQSSEGKADVGGGIAKNTSTSSSESHGANN